MKNSGIIFQMTLLIIFIITSLLSIFKISIDGNFNVTNFYNKALIDRENFENLSSLIFYELKILDEYILTKKTNSFEEYIFLNEKNEEIWEKGFENEKSLGGYYIKSSSKDYGSLSKLDENFLELEFEKEIKIKDENNKDYLTIKIATEKISFNCKFDKEVLRCLWEEKNVAKIKVEGEYF